MENILFQISTAVSIEVINDIIQSSEYNNLVDVEMLNHFHFITGRPNPIQQDKLIENSKRMVTITEDNL
ncbi:MAG TPA: hypothetical protein VK559_08860 [Ferruginibacter sp.]|nr:hypothetical protein [Ferruginibacter sp.]